MIIITSEWEGNAYCLPGDTFNLHITTERLPTNCLTKTVETKEVITETITKAQIINYACSFRFCSENGTVKGHHLAGFFGQKEELPSELKYAKRIFDLSEHQLNNFNESINTSC